jgi:hypothetical protein
MTLLRCLCLCLCLSLGLPALAQVVHVYPVKHRTAEELLPLAETALEGEGRAIADPRTNSLVLSGSRAGVRGALALLEALDVRARTVVLHYESRAGTELADEGARVRWRVDAGGVRIGNVAWPGAGTQVGVELDDRIARRSGSLSGQLRILDGRTGRIATGASAPVVSRRVVPGPFGPVVEESTQYVSADSGFEARPRVLSDGRVELSLRPFDESFRPDGTVATAGAETVLLLTPGETLAVGGILRDASGRSGSTLSGGGSTRGADELLLLVRASVE